jgi:hypothetical protein
MSITSRNSLEGRRNIDLRDIDVSLQILRETVPGWQEACEVSPNFEEQMREVMTSYALDGEEQGNRTVEGSYILLDPVSFDAMEEVAERCRVACQEIRVVPEEAPPVQGAIATHADITSERVTDALNEDDESGADGGTDDDTTDTHVEIPEGVTMSFVGTIQENIAAVRDASGDAWDHATIAFLSDEDGTLEDRVRQVINLYRVEPAEGLAALRSVSDLFPSNPHVQRVCDVLEVLCNEAVANIADERLRQETAETAHDAPQSAAAPTPLGTGNFSRRLRRRAEALAEVNPDTLRANLRAAGQQMTLDADAPVALTDLRTQFTALQLAINALSNNPRGRSYTQFAEALDSFMEIARSIADNETVRRNQEFRNYVVSMLTLLMGELAQLTRVFVPEGSRIALIGPSVIHRTIVDNNTRGMERWSDVDGQRQELARLRSQILQVHPRAETVARSVELVASGINKQVARVGYWQETTRQALALMLYAGVLITGAVKMFSGGAEETKAPDKKPAAAAKEDSSKKDPAPVEKDDESAKPDLKDAVKLPQAQPNPKDAVQLPQAPAQQSAPVQSPVVKPATKPAAPTPAPQSPAPAPMKIAPKTDKEKAVAVFNAVQREVRGNKMHLKFTDLQGYKVGESVVVYFGSGTLSHRPLTAESDGTFSFPITPAEVNGELAVSVKNGTTWTPSNQK